MHTTRSLNIGILLPVYEKHTYIKVAVNINYKTFEPKNAVFLRYPINTSITNPYIVFFRMNRARTSIFFFFFFFIKNLMAFSDKKSQFLSKLK